MIRIGSAQLWVHDQGEALEFYTKQVGMEVRSDVTVAELGNFRWLAVSPPSQPDIAVVLKDIQGQRAVLLFSWDSNFFLSVPRGDTTVRLNVRDLPLAPGRYFCDVGINQSTVTPAYDVILDYPIFEVINDGRIVHWQERPWGGIHWENVEWRI